MYNSLNDEDLESLYEKTVFTIFPSLFEGYGLPIVESLWRLRPCICHSGTSTAELGLHSGCIHIDMNNNIIGLKKEIDNLLNRENYDCKINEILKTKFKTWNEYTQEILNSFENQKLTHNYSYNTELSIGIPIYNFEKYIPETLTSIMDQALKNNVMVNILDGCSTDNTYNKIKEIQKKYHNLRYIKNLKKGGIDLDMSLVVSNCNSKYVWLFSGDDIMEPNSIDYILKQLNKFPNIDMILCRHMEHNLEMKHIHNHPVLNINITKETRYNLRENNSLKEYLNNSITGEAFFSFIGGIIIKRKTWCKIPLEVDLHNQCWAHITRLFSPKLTKFNLLYTPKLLLKRRGGNDSFGGTHSFKRFKIQACNLRNAVMRNNTNNKLLLKHVKRINLIEVYPTWYNLFKTTLTDKKEIDELNTIQEELINKESFFHNYNQKELLQYISDIWYKNKDIYKAKSNVFNI